jgi:2-methylisocitrate lyase-like PEP mutase family enzyme
MALTAQELTRRAQAFRALHEGPGAFVVPNPWDAATARLLAGAGFAALATTSAGLAFSLGRADGANQVGRRETLEAAAVIVGAVDLPVSADLESGFGASPDEVAETIRQASAVGLAGGSVEDANGRADDPIRPLGEAVERVQAAVEAVRGLDVPFVLTARAENFLYGRGDLADTIRRLQAYEEAGAEVLYAPGLPDLDTVRAVCSSVGRPVNVLAGGVGADGRPWSVAELEQCGARRISLGSVLARASLGAVQRAAREIAADGTFGFIRDAVPYQELNDLLG